MVRMGGLIGEDEFRARWNKAQRDSESLLKKGARRVLRRGVFAPFPTAREVDQGLRWLGVGKPNMDHSALWQERDGQSQKEDEDSPTATDMATTN